MKTMKLLWIAGLLAGLFSCALEPAWTPKGVALVYAGQFYTQVSPLNAPGNDGRAMANVFLKNGYDVLYRQDDGLASYYNGLTNYSGGQAQATYSQLVLDFQYAAAHLQSGDNFVFYWAGHGDQFHTVLDMNSFNSGFSVQPEDYPGQFKESTLILYDTIRGPGGFASQAAMTAVTLSGRKLTELLQTLPAGVNKIVLVDACMSGGLMDQGKEIAVQPNYTVPNEYPFNFGDNLWQAYQGAYSGSGRIPTDMVVLTAAGGAETTPDKLFDINFDLTANYNYRGTTYQGPYTYQILKALDLLGTEADRNGDGYVSTTEIHAVAAEGFQGWKNEYAAKRLIPGWNNSPRISGGPLEFLLIKVR